MAKVLIYTEETYRSEIFPERPDDDQYPMLYQYVEIPDDIVEAYEVASRAEHNLRRWIIKTYGESPRNPAYEQEWAAWMESTRDDSIVDRYGDRADAVWDEYLGGDGWTPTSVEN